MCRCITLKIRISRDSTLQNSFEQFVNFRYSSKDVENKSWYNTLLNLISSSNCFFHSNFWIKRTISATKKSESINDIIFTLFFEKQNIFTIDLEKKLDLVVWNVFTLINFSGNKEKFLSGKINKLLIQKRFLFFH
jgi:hypothetical protein